MRSRLNIQDTLLGFFGKYRNTATHISVSFPPAIAKGVDGDGVKTIARIVQNILSKEFGAKGYRLIEISKCKRTKKCEIPHLHIVVDKEVQAGKFRSQVYAKLGWEAPRTGESARRELVDVRRAHVATARYLAKTGRYEQEQCNEIPVRLSAVKRIFDGFGWGADRDGKGKMEKRPPPPENIPFEKGGKPFDFRRNK